MKRLIGLVVLLLLGFYVAWPGWTGYQIASALNGRDSPTLERKIVFDDVRRGLKPTVMEKIAELIDKSQSSAIGGVIAANMGAGAREKLADTALQRLVTAPNLIRVVHDGKSFKENAERILMEQIGSVGIPGLGGAGLGSGGKPGGGGFQIPGGLGGFAEKMGVDPSKITGIPGMGAPKAASPPAAPQAGSAAGQGAAPRYGFSNIKKFGFKGPLAFEVGVAKDPAAVEADVTVEMRFVGGDWRVVAVRPRV